MKYEVGKYYQLNPNKYYWCTNIQTRVKFQSPLIIKLEHFFMDKPVFGKMVKHEYLGDTETDVEIELSEQEDIINEYEFKKYDVPLMYLDFEKFFNS